MVKCIFRLLFNLADWGHWYLPFPVLPADAVLQAINEASLTGTAQLGSGFVEVFTLPVRRRVPIIAKYANIELLLRFATGLAIAVVDIGQGAGGQKNQADC